MTAAMVGGKVYEFSLTLRPNMMQNSEKTSKWQYII